jgi:hypothetical protein
MAFSSQRTILALPTWLDVVMGFRYPPYDLSKLPAVKNTLGFKKGETMADQRIQSPRKWGVMRLVVLASFVVNAMVLVGGERRERALGVFKRAFDGLVGRGRV